MGVSMNYRLKENVFFESGEDNAILVDSFSDKIYYIENIERDLLKALERYSVEEVIKEFESKYTGETIRTDIVSFFEKLVDMGLLEKY